MPIAEQAKRAGHIASALLYHNVGRYRAGTYPTLTVSPQVFERQIAVLARRGYAGISSRQWVEARRGGVLPAKPVILTFDDGYGDLVENAFPVLERYGFTATVFVVTDLIGGEDEWLRREGKAAQPLMTAGQIQDWAGRGIEFGAHGRTHADLTELPTAALADEVGASRRTLERLLGTPVTSFAYPYGFYNPEVLEVVRSEFQAAFTVQHGKNDENTDLHLLRRTMVAPTDGAVGILWRTAAGDYPPQRLRAKLSRMRTRFLGRRRA